ncbi:MAG: hypothetical protein IPN15_04030 [Saprospiraceae bacterium]|nr:hypothetical protein [Candidatus Vicinibacter affinis]
MDAGFYKFEGEWKTTPLSEAEILVEYTYTLFANQVLLYPFNWLFAHLFGART